MKTLHSTETRCFHGYSPRVDSKIIKKPNDLGIREKGSDTQLKTNHCRIIPALMAFSDATQNFTGSCYYSGLSARRTSEGVSLNGEIHARTHPFQVLKRFGATC